MFRRTAAPLRRRLVAMLVALPLAVAGALVTTAIPADAAFRTFTPIFSANTTGDIILRGNALETCPAGSTSGSTTCAQAQAGTGASQQNNQYAMTYVDTDSDSSTFDSSSATVTIPTGATVLYALLSWGGDTAGSTTSGLTGVAAPNAAAKNVASFKVPGATSYTSVTSTQTDTNGSLYQGNLNVTNAVKAAGSGVYSVGNVQAGTGGNTYAGWSMTIAYQDVTQPVRNLVVYSGFANINSSGPTSADITVSGFQTPPSGNVVTKLGVVAWEGDRGSTGDTMSLNSTSVSNTLNPVNDVMNSSDTDLNTAVTDRTPSYTNLMGTDVDRFDESGVLANGATTATIHLTTTGDTYYPGVVTLATDLYAPTLVATKTATDVNGGTLNRGDRLNYSIAITNTGNDAATGAVLTDAVPAGTTYVPGSLTIGGTGVTDTTGDDAGSVSSGTVTARFGSGANSTTGGSLAVNASTTVAFAVTVNNADTDGQVLSNQAALAYSSATTGTALTGASNTVTSTVVLSPVITSATLPGGEVGAAYSSQLTQSGGTSPFTWSVSSGSLPAGVTLSSSGLLSGTPTTAGTATFTVQVTDANNRSDTRSLAIAVVAGPTLTFAAPAQGEINTPYSATSSAAGGTTPYVWSVSSGTLPSGVTLNTATGTLSGTPTVAGSFPITLTVTDAQSQTSSQARTITIIAGPALTYAAPAQGEINTPYSTTFTASGGSGGYVWSITGTKPAGLTLDSATGVLSGTPSAAGSSTFTVTATDTNGQTASRSTTITIIAGPALTYAAPAQGEINTPYSTTLTASGGSGGYVWSTTGTLPAGLTLNTATGVLSGTPTAVGSSTFTVTVTDSNGQTASRSTTITIIAGPVLTYSPPPTAVVGSAYSVTLTASGGTTPYTWSTTGTLPAGITLNASTGVLSGTPTATGTSTFTVIATDANNQTASQSTSVTVASVLTLTAPTPATGEISVPYSLAFTAANGTGPYSYALTAGTLPAGLTLDPSTGVLSGTPTTARMRNFTITATDATGQTASRPTTITVVAGPSLTYAAPASGEIGTPYSTTFTATGGVGPYVWSTGTLPAGLTLNTATGVLSGTPTASGASTFTVTVTDANGLTASRSTTITFIAGPSLTYSPPPTAVIGSAYSDTLTADGGTLPYIWSTTGTLPAGLSLDPSTGTLFGTPTAVGTSTFTVTATDANNQSASQSTTVTVASVLTFAAPTPVTGEVSVAYSLTFAAANGASPYTYAVTGGTLPAGLSLDANSGVVSGTPTTAGSRTISVTATDSSGQTAIVSPTITVVAGPAMTFSTLPGGEVNTSYTTTLTASGGITPYLWSISSGTLPDGVTLNTSTGVLSGTPTTAGSSTFTVLVTDANGLTASTSTGITIVAGPSFTFAAPSPGQVGTAVSLPLSVSGGTSPLTWLVTAGPLPAGLTLNTSTGLLSGTPTAVGTTVFSVGVSDANGQSDTRTVTFVASRATGAVALTSASSVNFGTSVTLTATVTPASASGTVTFGDVPAQGLSAVLGTATVSAGVARLTVTLPSFGTHVVTAVYSGDSSSSGATSSTDSVEVTGYSGEVLVREFRSSGPNGATDSYVELYNTGPAVPLAGFVVATSAATSVTLPSTAGILGTGRSYLVAGSGYSLTNVTAADYTASLGTVNFAGVKVLAPDTAGTRTDAAGNAIGYHTGTALATLTGNPLSNWAWVRLETGGVVNNTGNNAADFKLVSTTGATVGGAASALGSPAPMDSASPYQQNAVLQSTLFDPQKGGTAGPNFYYSSSTKLLTIRRTITNTSGVTITKALLRITAISEANGGPQPVVTTQPTNPALMRLVGSTTPSEKVTLTSGAVVTVQNLAVNGPATISPGGGLNTTMNVPLGAGLAPGASVSVGFTFQVDSGSIWWFVYDVDATSGVAPQTMRVLARPGPATAAVAALHGRTSGKPSQYAGGHGRVG